MAGHSKWSKVKRIKGALDVKRGQLFSKLSREITVAAKTGGGDPDSNARLRSAVLNARAASMPADNIERAIRKGTGELEGQNYEELVYEGYGPGGVAIIVETATDNKNRTAADLRRIFSKNHGNLAASGSVSYMFHKKGQITIPCESADEDRVMAIALEAGAEDMTSDDARYVIITPPDKLYAVAEAVKAAALIADSQKFTFVPESTTPIADESLAAQALRLCDALEENDDVQNVYSNFDIPESVLANLAA